MVLQRYTDGRFFGRQKRALQLTPGLFAGLRLLFEHPAGGTLPNGNVDLGYNCFAKGFVTAWLARLQGIAADHYAGRALVAWVRPQPSTGHRIDPHAWAGVWPGTVLDLSITNLDGREFYSAGHEPVPGIVPVSAHAVGNSERFEELHKSPPPLPLGAHVFYHATLFAPFDFSAARIGPERLNSPPTKEIAARYPGNPVVAKAILHLHRVALGEHPPLTARSQEEAWEMLARWNVNVVPELDAILRQAWHPNSAQSNEAAAASCPACETV